MSQRTKHLVRKLGGPAKVGKFLGITSQAVSQWAEIPLKHCWKLATMPGSTLTIHELNPTFFAPAPSSQDEAA